MHSSDEGGSENEGEYNINIPNIDSLEGMPFDEIKRKFSLALSFMSSITQNTPVEQVLDELTLDGVAALIKSGKCKNVVTMAGAGISTSAGIPDFRSPGSGLYDNLQKYNLPYPQAIFEINYFTQNPKPFFVLAKELYPGIFKPTVCHYFIKLLEKKGLLLRHYTQNIDTLERVAGINSEKLVEAHGTFHTSHCLDCNETYTMQWMQEKIFSDTMPKCEKCNGVVKPDIVFFGESLPSTFFNNSVADLPKCDLLIIMGSSLVVQPFASLKDRVPNSCPRLLINREKVGDCDFASLLGCPLNFNPETNKRDVFFEGSCDDGCLSLAEKLGWDGELKEIMHEGHELVEKQSNLWISKHPAPHASTIAASDETILSSDPVDVAPLLEDMITDDRPAQQESAPTPIAPYSGLSQSQPMQVLDDHQKLS